MTEPGPPLFGSELAAARKRRGLNVRQAAQRAGISEGRWRQLELGYQQVAAGVRVPANPKPTTVRAVADAVGLDLRVAFARLGLPVPDDLVAQAEVEVDLGSVGRPTENAEEILFRLPPGLSARQRETAKQLARQSVQTYLDSLREE